jgi:hypothetical protein
MGLSMNQQLAEEKVTHCANCGALMHGEYCQECGQSIHSVLRPLHHMLEETVETVLHVDGRIVHTLPPLLLKPGFLTLEYFSGRRVRYIAPFRLMFVLCVLSFFVFHLMVENMATKTLAHLQPNIQVQDGDFADAKTPDAVRKELRIQLANMEKVRNYEVMPGYAAAAMAKGENQLREEANKRLVQLGAAPMSAASAAAPATASSSSDEEDNHRTGLTVDPTENMPKSVHISWLPEMANARLTTWLTHMGNNWHAYKHGDPVASEEAKQRMINGFFGVLPQTMFVLIPVFAGMLALFYVFKRRLYMEHLIVSLHSHAFMFLVLLLYLLLGMLSSWLKPHAAWTGVVLALVQTVLVWWVPVYLLIMQKRIYRQGWPMTVVKWWFIGWFYFWLLLLALVVATMLGMAQ